MTIHSVFDAEGVTLSHFSDSQDFEDTPLTVTVPGLTFDLGPWLILSPYGDDDMSESIRKRLFGYTERWALAIHKATGDIALAFYIQDRDGHSFMIQRWMPSHYPGPVTYKLPAFCLDRLDELRNKKRPFKVFLDPGQLQLFIDRWLGWSDLVGDITFQIKFEDAAIEISGDLYRAVTYYSEVSPQEEEEE